MVTRSKKQNTSEKKKGRVKVGKLKLNKETIKDLTDSEQKRAKGGIRAVDEDHSKPVENCLSYTCVTVCTRNLECI